MFPGEDFMRKFLLAAVLPLAFCVNAHAADNGIYVGGALSRTAIDSSVDLFGSLAARVEYESFEIADADNVELWSFGLTWTFF